MFESRGLRRKNKPIRNKSSSICQAVLTKTQPSAISEKLRKDCDVGMGVIIPLGSWGHYSLCTNLGFPFLLILPIFHNQGTPPLLSRLHLQAQ